MSSYSSQSSKRTTPRIDGLRNGSKEFINIEENMYNPLNSPGGPMSPTMNYIEFNKLPQRVQLKNMIDKGI